MLTTLTSPETLFPINFSAGTDWAEAEFGSIDLGDVRSSRRLVASFASMLASPLFNAKLAEQDFRGLAIYIEADVRPILEKGHGSASFTSGKR